MKAQVSRQLPSAKILPQVRDRQLFTKRLAVPAFGSHRTLSSLEILVALENQGFS
jgi:hypothetical protein